MNVSKMETSLQNLLGADKVRAAFAYFESQAEKLTDLQIEICRIPAPPFGEQKRAEFFKNKFIEYGYHDARIDGEGNVLAFYQGENSQPLLVVSAHLDTVFPAETEIVVKREGSKIFAPGIMDDGCGLIALLTLADVLRRFNFGLEKSVLFVATVGEEAAGNLRGVRHLLTAGEYAAQITAFISLDGAGAAQIVNRALGSRRYSWTLTSVGGHSWIDAGAPNPIHAAGRAIAKLNQYQFSLQHKASYNVGRITGGTSVNAVAAEVTAEIDLRSENAAELLRLDAFFCSAVAEAVDEENEKRLAKYPPLESTLTFAGERPAGATAENSPLVALAVAATKALKIEPQLALSSTDSNFPMSRNIPAITIGAGGAGDKMHTLGEWYDPTKREIGLQRALLIILETA